MIKINLLISFLFLGIISCDNSPKKTAEVSIKSEEKKELITYEVKENSPLIIDVKENDDDYKVVISEISGDLNKDGFEDLVVVKQDTINEKRPYRLEIYLSNAEEKLKLFLSSDRAIVANYPNGNKGFSMVTMFSGATIKNGTLTINHELIRGSFSHQFRFQHNRFELIGFRSAGVSPPDVEEVDFNLSTGIKVTKRSGIGTDIVASIKKTKEIIDPLPDLADFEPYDNQY